MKVVIPMAGAGSRFAKHGETTPKPLIKVQGVTLIEHAIRSFDVHAQFIFVTRKFPYAAHNTQLSELLHKLRPEHVEIQLSQLTQGASDSVLAAEHLINNDEPLIVYNCDQIMQWDPQEFLKFVTNTECDGAVVLHKSSDPKHSYAVLNDNKITRIVEKQCVSNHALVGFHYWKKGLDFVSSARNLKEVFTTSGRPECYVSETYNYLIEQGARIAPYHVAPHVYVPLGTPEDVATYVGTQNEFYSEKPKTIFCDIDGTILVHLHKISQVLQDAGELLTGVRDKFDEWDSKGHHIVLTTARKESARAHTVKQLADAGIIYDQLIMGITSGTRVLINDKKLSTDPDRARNVNVITNQGWQSVDWKVSGL
jgi:NDP-sugar pyrophosphorylase family protein